MAALAGEKHVDSTSTMRVWTSPTLISLLLLVVLVLAFFGDVLFAGNGRALGAPGTDNWKLFIAWRAFGFGELAHGHNPLWNPHTYSGAPYFGGMQSGLLYP